jgi:hypothetical protein
VEEAKIRAEDDAQRNIEGQERLKTADASRSKTRDVLPISDVDEDARSLGEADVFDPPTPPPPKKPMVAAALKAKEQILERNSKSLANLGTAHNNDMKSIYEEFSRSVPEHLMGVHQPHHDDEDAGSLGEADVFDVSAPPPPKKPMVAAALKAKEQILERNSKSLANFGTAHDNDMKSIYEEFSRSVPEHLMGVHQPHHDDEDAGSLGEADVFDVSAPPPPKKPMVAAALKAKEQILERNSKSIANFGTAHDNDTKSLSEEFSKSVPDHLIATNQPRDEDDAGSGEAAVFDPPTPPPSEKPVLAAALMTKEQIGEGASQSHSDLNFNGTVEGHSAKDNLSRSESDIGTAKSGSNRTPTRRKKSGVGFGNIFLLEARQLKESGGHSAPNGSSGSFSQFDTPEQLQDSSPRSGGGSDESTRENPDETSYHVHDDTGAPSKNLQHADEEGTLDGMQSSKRAEPVFDEAGQENPVAGYLSPVQKARLALENRAEQERVANSQPQIVVAATRASNSASQARSAQWAKKPEKKENTENKNDSESTEPNVNPPPTGAASNLERMTRWRKNGKRLVDEKLGSYAPSRNVRRESELVETRRRLDEAKQPAEDATIDPSNPGVEEPVPLQSTVAVVESVKSVKEVRLSLERRVQEKSFEQTTVQAPNATSSSRAAEWAKASAENVDEKQSNIPDKPDALKGDRLLWWRKNGKRLVDARRGLVPVSNISEWGSKDSDEATGQSPENVKNESFEEELSATSIVEKRRRAAEARHRALQVRNGNNLEPAKPTGDIASRKEVLAEKRRQVVEARKKTATSPVASNGEASRSVPPSEQAVPAETSVSEAKKEEKIKSGEESITTAATAMVASGRTSPGEESGTTTSGTTATTEGAITSGGRVAALAGKVENAAAAAERRMKRLAESERLAERTARARQARLAKESQLSIGSQQVLANKTGAPVRTPLAKEPRLSPIALASSPTSTSPPKPQQSSLIPHMVREADRLSGFICRYEHKLETLCKSLLAVARQYENDSEAAAAVNLPLPEMYKFVREREWYQRYAKGSSRPSMLFAGLKAEADRAQERRDQTFKTYTGESSDQDANGEKVYKVTPAGEGFLKMDGPVEADVGRFLSSVHNKGEGMTKSSLEKNWTDIARLSGDVQSERVREKLDELMQFSLDARFIE